MKTWVKLYTEVCTDPDIGELTLAQKGVWMMLLALAGQIDARDENDFETGELDTLARAAGIPRGSHSLTDYERGKRLVSELAHGDPAAYQQYLQVLVRYVGV